MFFEKFSVFLLNFERVMSFGVFLWTQTAIQNVELPLLFLHCELQRHLEKVEGWDSKHLKDSFAASNCPICAMFDIDIFCYDLVSFKGFDLSPLTFFPLWSMQNMLWCLWVEAERWYGLILMCKYCSTKKNNDKQVGDICEMINATEWKSSENHVMMNVVRNIFLYFEIIREKEDTTCKVGKAVRRTLQRECFY